MDLVQQYIIQCITSAANNLRLNTEKIEVVALLRESITSSADLENEIAGMKKVTELSTFAIRLGEIYNYIAKSKIDFLKITDKFKEHSHYIVKDLNNLLDKVSPQNFRQLMNNMHHQSIQADIQRPQASGFMDEKVKMIPEPAGAAIPENAKKAEAAAPAAPKVQKEDFLLDIEEEEEDLLFENYEEKILGPIKDLDQFLKNLVQNRKNPEEIDKFEVMMRKNAELSSRIGFEIIANMHRIFANGLRLIKDSSFYADKEITEAMRACLIVIVAVVRGKEVDITNYLNRAEEFGRKIQIIN